MDPAPPGPPLLPPPLPPPLLFSPAPPPLWPGEPPPNAPLPRAAVLLVTASLAVVAVAIAGLFLVLTHRPVANASRPSDEASPSPPSTATTEAASQYLAAVAPVNADGDALHAALSADAALPCSCSPGEFSVRADTVARIPVLNRDLEAFQVVLQRIKSEVPSAAADVDKVIADNQQYMGYLAAAYRASQQRGSPGLGADITIATAFDHASGPDFVRLRADLGLPPPLSG